MFPTPSSSEPSPLPISQLVLSTHSRQATKLQQVSLTRCQFEAWLSFWNGININTCKQQYNSATEVFPSQLASVTKHMLITTLNRITKKPSISNTFLRTTEVRSTFSSDVCHLRSITTYPQTKLLFPILPILPNLTILDLGIFFLLLALHLSRTSSHS